MTPAELMALAQRLRDHAAMHDTDSPHDGDQQQWKLVPVTPTPEMLAAVSWPGCAATDYAHMLAAAPQPPSAQADAVEALLADHDRTLKLLDDVREWIRSDVAGGACWPVGRFTRAELLARIDAELEGEK